ncbi:hypothetical protein L198_00099 [Cryptococcus wingfieldii CBS 7118]|uniref:WSC domain-containing protein n=1 Tax=Cryptococcus wingfieldii CBS 7118 TaxID=1295528 RepID=A0A1E3K597_9TREE|nr:hypothetical protein L198_00099 [Cryptococcus wingfieldii CBS 7118]ODO08374.1 hypothetical protein L198_00099 [Cryptococcus wingfieldii CBS 7118]
MSSVIPLLLLASLVNGAAIRPDTERRDLFWSWGTSSGGYYTGQGNSGSTTSSSQAATYLAQAQSSVSGLDQGWSAAGCYDDSNSARTLASASTYSWWMDYSTCTTFCGNKGYTYAGVESSNCYCSNTINRASTIQPYYKCSGTCSGNWFEDCPSNNYINVFTKGSTTTSSAKTSSAATSTAKTSTTSTAATSTAKTSTTSSAASTSTVKSSTSAASSSLSSAASSSSSAAKSSTSSTSVAQSTAAQSTSASSSSVSKTSTAAVIPTISVPAVNTTSVISAAQNVVSSAVVSVASEASQVVSSVSAQVNTTSVASQIQSVASQVSSAVPAINTTSVVSQVQSIASSVASSVEAVPTSVASSVISEVSSFASSASAQVVSAVANVTSSIASDIANATSAVSSIYSEATEAASSAVSSIASDISSAYSSVLSEESSAVSSVVEEATSVISSAAAAASSAVSSLPTGWAVTACIGEGTSGRALPATSTSSSDMTQAKCVSYCSNAGYTLAAIEYASECWCSNVLQNGASLTKTSDACTMPCSGDSTSICGGPSALTLIANATAIASLNADLTSGTVSLPTNWAVPSTSCIAEGTTGRALTGSSYSSADMTLAKCSSYCTSEGYGIAGVEYSSECYCGNQLNNGASLTLSSSACTMACSGDSTTMCGGSGALSIAVSSTITSKLSSDLSTAVVTLPTGWEAASTVCIAEGTSGRALAHESYASDDMTLSTCLSYCGNLGWQYAGIEYGRECYCGDYLANGASLDLTATCNVACGGDSTETCGGGNALSLYVNPTLALDLTTVLGYNLQGCVQEVTGRLLSNNSFASDSMTVDMCVGFCSDQGLALAGLEYGRECYCGSALTSAQVLSTQCDMKCAGDSTESCGGADAIKLYLAGDSVLSVL